MINITAKDVVMISKKDEKELKEIINERKKRRIFFEFVKKYWKWAIFMFVILYIIDSPNISLFDGFLAFVKRITGML